MLQIRGRRGEPVGLGFLVADDLALTCAHVVDAALDQPPGTEPAADARIGVTFPLLRAWTENAVGGADNDETHTTARVEHQVPVLPSGAGDVAVLRLSAAVRGTQPVQLIEEPDVWEHPARVFGFPTGRPGGVWHSAVLRARQASGWVQADMAASGYRVSRGFSGSPVWDEELGGVVGMMALAEEGEPPASYLIPTAGLLNAWPDLRPLALPPSPFRRLSSFGEVDAAVFHGRRAESDAVARMVDGGHWTAIVGPSGSGKSSLAQAGVVPRMRPKGNAVVVLRPSSGSSPSAGLAAELLALLEPGLSETDRIDRLPKLAQALIRKRGLADVLTPLLHRQDSRRLLIVIDQFEELLAHEAEAVDELAGILFDESLPETVRVLTTLRADFLGAVLAHPRFGHAFDGRQVYALGPMHTDQLREVVTLPVDAVPGVRYEPHLVDRILADTGAAPGALPLLSFALDQLWREQQRYTPGRLTHEAYERIGGVAGALRDHLVEVWTDCIPQSDEAMARRLFTRLIRIPLESAAVTRRVATRAEMGEDEWRLAQRLAAARARLLVIGQDSVGAETVELIHEAIITSWDKLEDWAAEDRSFLVWRETLDHDRRRWEEDGRALDLLPTAATLAGSQQWLAGREAELTAVEREYLKLGRAHHRSRARKRRALWSGLGLLVVVALLFGSLFAYTRQESQQRQAIADSRSLVQFSQDQEAFDPVLSVKLALAAQMVSSTQEARSQLLRQYLEYSDSTRILSGLLGTVEQFQTSRNGKVIFARSKTGRAMLFVHALNDMVRSEHFAVKQVLYAMVSADGSRVAYVCENGAAGWFQVHPDADRIVGKVHQLPKVTDLMKDPSDLKNGFAMSVDGRFVAVRSEEDLMWWDLDRGTVGGRVRTPAEISGRLWIGTDNKSLLLEESHLGREHPSGLVALDMASGKSRTVVRDVDDVLVSGDRSAVVVCRSGDKGAFYRLLRVSDGTQQARPFYKGDLSSCTEGQGIDVTGHRIVTKSGKDLALVDISQGKEISGATQLDGITATASDLVLSSGNLLLAGHSDSLINYVELSAEPNVLDVSDQKLTADGSRTVSVVDDGATLQLRPALSSPGDDLLIAKVNRPQPYWLPDEYHLVFGPGRKLLADWDAKNAISVREVSTLRRTARITMPKPPSAADVDYFFDREGHLVTVSGTRVQQWDARTGKELAHYDVRGIIAKSRDANTPRKVFVGNYPTDNQVAVLVWGDPTVRVINLTTGRTTATVKVPIDAIAMQFDPSGRYFAVLRSAGILELWRRDPPRKELGPLRSVVENADKPYVANFLDGEGRFVVAANSSVRIYRIGDRAYTESYDFGREPSSLLGDGSYDFRDITSDGGSIIYQDSRNTGGPLRLDPDQWRHGLCDVIGNLQFTADEIASIPTHLSAERICP
ncbi:trypsin-like peptidase domain-containing protein [Streptomyces sp. NPDC005925]|uniref:nSTAND1 domain-containing NTPase n=1 Tax=Streptomyces sp. NPDC005925 TaxID=3157172 RepID=UPI0033D80A02